MQIVNPQLISGKKVLLRLDIDVPLKESSVVSRQSSDKKMIVAEDFRLRAGLPTLKLCLEYAAEVIAMGHIGRPSFAEATEGKPDKFFIPKYSVAPIVEWFKGQGFVGDLESGKLRILENLRFDPREEAGEISFAKELASMGDIYINEAFASYRPAVSTTLLPTLLPHAAGLRFMEEVRVLREVRDPPAGGHKKPFVAIMGGAKVADKLPVITALAQKADAVLVGGKIAAELSAISYQLSDNVFVGKLNKTGTDIAPETTESWRNLIMQARMIVWNGPVGKFEDPKNNQSAKMAELIIKSGAKIVVGGGDTISLLGSLGLLGKYEKKAFVSTGGGAMLKFLADGTLPTIEALK